MVYYMSIEYLVGRSLQNAVMNLQLENEYGQALKEIGFDLENIYDEESDAALGNGGLGRLAACFLDSLASMCVEIEPISTQILLSHLETHLVPT